VLEEAVAASASIAGVLRHLGVPWSGGMHAHISRRIKFFELDTDHFTGKGHNRGRQGPDRKTPEQILVVRKPGSGRAKPRMLRRALIEFGVPYQCAACGIGGSWKLVRSYRMPPALGSPIRVDQVLTLFDRLDEPSAS
jgi:hypothetical protein